MPRRRTISEREQKRREKQRETPHPAYALHSGPPSQASDVLGPGSAGARSALLAPRPPPTFSEVPPLLHTRRAAAAMLSVSIATLQRLEKQGRLRPIKLSNKPTAMTFYAHTDLVVIASGR